jgi:hypothetical protein
MAAAPANALDLLDGRSAAPMFVVTARKLADALACLKQLAGLGNAAAVQAEFSRLKLAPLPASMAEDLPAEGPACSH